jgi:Protein of unknown function (DUF2971)
MKRTLYKYFPLSTDEHLERFRAVLNGWIYFASPLRFNDPFEVSNVLPSPTREEFENLLQSVASNSHVLSRSAKDRVFRAVSQRVLGESPQLVTNEWLASIGVLSLSESFDDILMWSHYASNHNGVCVGFDSAHAPFDAAKPIEYLAERSVATANLAALNDEELVHQVLFRKSPNWSYEKEWRAVKRPVREEEKCFYQQLILEDPERTDTVALLFANEGGPGLYEFSVRAIRRVYFGARVDLQKKKSILDVIDSLASSARVFQFDLDRRYFALLAERQR